MVRQSVLKFLKIISFTSILFINVSFVVAQKNEAPFLDMTVNRGVIKPISLAVPSFIKESGANSIISRELAKVISNNLNYIVIFYFKFG